MLEAVVARERALAGIRRLPRRQSCLSRGSFPPAAGWSARRRTPWLRPAGNAGQLQARDGKLHGQLARLAGLQHQVRPAALDAVHLKAQQPVSRARLDCSQRSLAAAWSKCDLGGRSTSSPSARTTRDVKRLARLVAQRRMKAKLLQPDQRLDRSLVPPVQERSRLRPVPAARCAVPCPRPTIHSPSET